jgi:Sulfotransferase family
MTSIDTAQPPPRVIGATGGSGTRAVARVARRAGLFIGTELNQAEDSVAFVKYFNRWIPAFLSERDDPELESRMLADLGPVLEQHRPSPNGGPWGWKEPRSLYMLPFLERTFPGLRFIHVVRDGRDMAFSRNQRQPTLYADAYLGHADVEPGSPPRSIALWSRINLDTARFGEQVLRERYLRVRYEDLCAAPGDEVARVLEFLELAGDAAELAEEVQPPPSLGRWRRQDPAVVRELEQIARPALEHFGYLDRQGATEA